MLKSIENIEWKLLREQKKSLVEVISGKQLTQKRKDHLEGILSLIDGIQDDVAEDILGEEKVFGKL